MVQMWGSQASELIRSALSYEIWVPAFAGMSGIEYSPRDERPIQSLSPRSARALDMALTRPKLPRK